MMRGMVVLVLGMAAASVAVADVESGPEVGKAVPALTVHGVTGAVEGKEVNYVAERKDKPTIVAFVRKDAFTRPMARFLRELDMALPEVSDQAYTVAVWLTDDVDATKDYLPKVQQSIKLENTAFAVFTGGKDGPNEWTINNQAGLTVVVIASGKVAARFGYDSVNETDVPKVRDALKKALGK